MAPSLQVNPTPEIFEVGGNKICFGYVGQVLLVVYGRTPWSDEDYARFLDIVESWETERRVQITGNLSFSTSQVPTIGQRRMSEKIVFDSVQARADARKQVTQLRLESWKT